MNGWKTWAGAAIMAAGAVADFLGYPVSGAIYALGAAFGLVGIGHKVEKASENVNEENMGKALTTIVNKLTK